MTYNVGITMNDINQSKIGRYIQQKEGYKAFTPFDFPPKGGFGISPKLYKKHEEAIRLVGKLDGITRLLPDKDFFLLMFIRKDATYSSQIEGTKATLQDAVAESVTEEKSRLQPDVDDIVHYVEAVNYGIERTKTLPISLRLIREIHERLMTGARSTQHSYPGEFRRSQNWIGGKSPSDASFVPPAPHDMNSALGELEKFIHAEDDYPSLVKAGLIHAQFETIHPFTDGNGRSARAMAMLVLFQEGYDVKQFFSIEQYYDQSPRDYYDALQKAGAEKDGDISLWLEYFTDGLAVELSRVKERVMQLSRDLKLKGKLGRQIPITERQIKILEYMEVNNGFLTTKDTFKVIPMTSRDTIIRDLRYLIDKGVVRKVGRTKASRYVLVE